MIVQKAIHYLDNNGMYYLGEPTSRSLVVQSLYVQYIYMYVFIVMYVKPLDMFYLAV